MELSVNFFIDPPCVVSAYSFRQKNNKHQSGAKLQPDINLGINKMCL